MAIGRIQISGLKELQKQLRDMDVALPRKIRVALNSASQLVIDWGKPRVARRTGRAAGSMKVRSSQRTARVATGGARAPYMPWLDFGGAVGRDDATKREFIKIGRYVYPALEHQRDEITQQMAKALTELATEVGLEVT